MSTLGLASIILIGISAGFPNPGTYVQVNFAAGPTGGAPAGQKVLIIGNKTSTGTAVADSGVYGPDTATPAQTENDVITLTGAGSQVHIAWRRFNAVNKTTPVYFICAAESAGAQAAGVLAVTGPATSSGNIRIWWSDQFVDVPVFSGDSATTIGTNIANAVNAQVAWGITATNNSGIVAITAKNHGPEQNWTKIQAQLGPVAIPAGVACNVFGSTRANNTAYSTGVFVAPAVPNGFYYQVSTGGTSAGSPPTFGTTLGGTTTDGTATLTCWGTLSSVGIASLGGGATADNYTNALQAVNAIGYYDIVPCDSDTTNVGRVVTAVNAQALPTVGIRQRVFSGNVDSLANALTQAASFNAPRCEVQWANATDYAPLEVAANAAAIYSLYEQTGNTGYRYVGRLNYSLFPTANPQFNDQAVWKLVASRNGPNAGPTSIQITSALQGGLTPYAILKDGTLQLVKRVTSRSLNGSTPDFRIRDGHKVAIMDAWATAAQTIIQQQFGAKDIIDPPPVGSGAANGPPPNPFATNVNLIKNALTDLTTKMGDAGLLQNAANTNATCIVQRETNPSTRVSASFDLATADVLDQVAVAANQVA